MPSSSPLKEPSTKCITKRPLMTSEFRDFTGITQARLTLITYRSVVRRNIAILAEILERPRKVCPSVLHEKPTSPSSTRQALRGNGGISRARAESNIAECANERFFPPFFLCPLPLVQERKNLFQNIRQRREFGWWRYVSPSQGLHQSKI